MERFLNGPIMRTKFSALFLSTLCTSAWSVTQPELNATRDRAAAWLVRNQQGDGRWTASSGGLDVQVTSTVIEALVSSGYANLPQVASGIAWLQNAEAGSVDALARQVHALAVAGAVDSAKRLATALVNAQDPSTGAWGAYPGYRASAPDTPLALLALLKVGVPFANEAGIRQVLIEGRQQLTGGLSMWWPNLRWIDERYGPSQLATKPGSMPTAYVVEAFRALGSDVETRSQGVAFLREAQVQSGGYAGAFVGGSGNVSVWETALAAEVLAASSTEGRNDPAVQLALTYVAGAQGADGSWGGDGFSTASALKLIGTGGSAHQDSDGDGVADALEHLLGTDSARADSKDLKITGPDNDDHYVAYRMLRGRPVSETLPLGGIASCCATASGALPSGLSLTASGTPLTVSLAGTPVQAGYYDLEFGYRDLLGIDRVAMVNIEVSARLFRIDPDPFPLSALFANPVINRLRTGSQFLVDDFNGDGRLDLVGHLNGYNERFGNPDCSPCASYSGPDWGLVIGLQRVGADYAYVNGVASSTQIPGDVRSMHTLDFNNDGRRDILLVLNRVVTTSTAAEDVSARPFRALVLMRNDSANGGTMRFTDVTDSVGLAAAPEGYAVVTDGNLDGLPDLVVSNGVLPARYYQFDGSSGSYVDRSGQSGLGVLGQSIGLNFDPESGQTIDIATLSASHGLRFYRNNGNGTFSLVDNVSPLSSLATHRVNRIAVTDLNRDRRPDLVLFESAVAGSGAASTYAGSVVTVLESKGNQNGRPTFEIWPPNQLTTASGSTMESNLGGAVADLDSDGRQDIVLASRDISSGVVSSLVFRQHEDGTFDRLTAETGFPAGVTAFDSPVPVDLDDDAAIDLVFPNSSNTAYRLTNEGTAGHSITVALKGKAANRHALGARVRVIAGAQVLEQQLLANHANTSRLHFGVGTVDEVTVEVYWPDGSQQSILVTDLDRLVTVTQP